MEKNTALISILLKFYRKIKGLEKEDALEQLVSFGRSRGERRRSGLGDGGVNFEDKERGGGRRRR